jgi:hypothetical protein
MARSQKLPQQHALARAPIDDLYDYARAPALPDDRQSTIR